MTTTTLLLLAVVPALLLVLGCTVAAGQSPSESGEDSNTIQDFAKEHEQNSVLAKRKYRGTKQVVSGKVKKLDLYMGIQPPIRATLDVTGFKTNLTAVFGDSLPMNWQTTSEWPGYEWMEDVNVGDRMEVECTITGFSERFLSLDGEFEVVPNLNECQFLSVN